MNKKLKLGIVLLSCLAIFGVARAKVNLDFGQCGDYYQKVTVNNTTSYNSVEVCAREKPNITKINGTVGVNKTFREDTDYCKVEVNGTTGDFTCGNASYSTNATIENRNGTIFVEWQDWSGEIPLQPGDEMHKIFDFKCPTEMDTEKSLAECSEYFLGQNQTGDILMESLQGTSKTLKKLWECETEKSELKEEKLDLKQKKISAVEEKKAKDIKLETFREKWKSCTKEKQNATLSAIKETREKEERECRLQVGQPLRNDLKSCQGKVNTRNWILGIIMTVITLLGAFIVFGGGW